MSSAPRCPVCKTPHHLGAAKPGAMLICDTCQEVFEAPIDVPEEAPASGGKPVARPAAKGKPKSASAAKDKPKKAQRDDDDADNTRDRSEPRRPARAGRRRREEESRGGGVVLLLLGLGIAAFVMVGLIGGAIWYTARERAKDAQAQVEAAEQETQQARRDAELERLKAEAELAAAREQPGPNPAPAPPLPENPRPGPMPMEFDPPGGPPFGGPGVGGNPPFPPPGIGGNPQFPPRPGPGPEPVVPPKPAGPPVPRFEEPANPFKPGTQTKLRELRSVALPRLAAAPAPKAPRPGREPVLDYVRLAHCPKNQLLFALTPKSVWVYDLKANKALGTQEAKEVFTDMSLSPDRSALFVADYGSERTGYGEPVNPSRVHRFDMATRKWEERKAPKIAWKVEAVDSHRVLLLEQDQWVSVTLNKWEEDGVGIRELARIGSDYNGDIEYDPRTGRIYHGNRGISSPQITVNAVDGDKLKAVGNTGTYGTASKGGGGSVVLSQDGSRFYYGRLQVKADTPKENLEMFPEVILAASRDIAFGGKAYYRATTGSKLGEFEFKTTTGNAQRPWEGGSPTVIAVSPDGQSVWVLDRDKNAARQFAIEGEK